SDVCSSDLYAAASAGASALESMQATYGSSVAVSPGATDASAVCKTIIRCWLLSGGSITQPGASRATTLWLVGFCTTICMIPCPVMPMPVEMTCTTSTPPPAQSDEVPD